MADVARRMRQQTVQRGRTAARTTGVLGVAAITMKRRADRANAMGDAVEIQATQLQKVFMLMYDEARRVKGETKTLRSQLVMKLQQLRSKRRALAQMARRLGLTKRAITRMMAMSRRLEAIEQNALAKSEFYATARVNSGANAAFARSQLPRRPPR